MLTNFKLGTKISLAFGLILVLVIILVSITIIKVDKSEQTTDLIQTLRIPTAISSIQMMNGINSSLAALRAWIILDDEKFKESRALAWKEEINPVLNDMTTLSKNWTNPDNVKRLAEITLLIKSFKKYQEDIENIAHTQDNQPALKILFKEAIPKASALTTHITNIIELELKEPATKQRKMLLGIMADIRGSNNLALSYIRAYLLSADDNFKKSFESSWMKNEEKFLQLHKHFNLLTPKQKEEFQKFTDERDLFVPLPKKMFEIRNSQEWNISYKLLKNNAVPTVSKIKSILDLMIDDQKELMMKEIENSKKSITSLESFAWIALFISIIISILISFLTKRLINKQLNDFQDGLLSFFKYLNKETNTIPHLDDTINDEIGNMSKIINNNIVNTSKLLQEHEEIFRQLHENQKALDEHAIVTITNTDGTITYVNDKLLSISGYSREELLGNNNRILNSGIHDKSFWKNMYKTVSNKQTWQNEVCNKAKDGSLYWVDTTIVPTLDTDNNITSYTAIRTNITKRKENEAELIKAKEIAILSDKAKSEFLANMSHEIRTPLNAIMGFIGILKESEKEKEKLQYLETIDTSSKSLTNIINDILDFSKIESGKLNIEYIDFNPKYELTTTKELFDAKCEEKSINLSVDFINLPNFLNGDILRIKQVVSNILSNAIKFTPKYKSIFVSVQYNTDKLKISIKDEGVGITKEYQKRIFDSFSQADNSTTREHGGTGLGLSISYNLIKLMGGELKVKSEIGKGSEFYFSLPLKLGQETSTSTSSSNQDLSKLKILLVEDNKANQMFMKVILKKLKITFDIANDGLEAVEAFKNSKYNVILMDENMPNLNGIEATKQILEIEKDQNLVHTPIIALTANALKGDRERFLEAGMDEYLTKPLNKNKLTNILGKLL